jgi:hypothetical protein
LTCMPGLGCSETTASVVDASPLDAALAPDPCDPDAFTGVGSACPAASPLRCFPLCEAGGCSCNETDNGPRWACVTDLSCLPQCAPLDDACASDAGDVSDAGDAGDVRDAGSE